ncbi:MAG: DMT family transporter [Pseudomonadota bacterium]
MPTLKFSAADNLQGSLFMLLAMASFAVGDAILKHVSGHLPLSQILVTRGVFATVLLFLIASYMGQLRSPKIILSIPFIVRLVAEVLATVFFLTALFNMPFANASAIMQALPLTVSLGAAYFFGELIGWRRIIAISVGFVGVLLIVQPGLEGFNVYSLYCLIAVCCTTTRDLATRKLAKDIPSLFVSLVSVAVVVVLGLFLSLFQPWQPAAASDYAALAIASVFLITAFFGIISAMRIGEVGVVTPFRYSVLLFAVIIGFFFFEEIPDFLTVTGSIIVVLSGLYTLYRERISATPDTAEQ